MTTVVRVYVKLFISAKLTKHYQQKVADATETGTELFSCVLFNLLPYKGLINRTLWELNTVVKQ